MHIEVDPNKCIYCKTCEMVCSYVKTKEFKPSSSLIRIFREDVSNIGSHICKQCKQAECVKACRYSALKQGTKIVILDRKKCVNCGRCYVACPYHAIWEVDGKAMKCDVCLACIKYCPRFAIKVDSNDPKS